MTYTKNCSTEKATAKRLVTVLLDAGCAISVHNGEEYVVKRSVTEWEILQNLQQTDEETIVARFVDYCSTTGEPAYRHAGTFFLIYGNDPTGLELIADHSDNEFSNAVWSKVYPE